ncbi:MAG: hypothetical protein H7X74_08175 [Methyloceanibacter sp.]|nr:hypothetical protein [Methyloceanibacter sp.]
MWRVVIGVLLGMGLIAGVAAAETSEQAAQPKCLKAEINPVTGHVLCIDPLGAPVEPPPAEAKLPCKPEDARASGAMGRSRAGCERKRQHRVLTLGLVPESTVRRPATPWLWPVFLPFTRR